MKNKKKSVLKIVDLLVSFEIDGTTYLVPSRSVPMFLEYKDFKIRRGFYAHAIVRDGVILKYRNAGMLSLT